MPTQSKPRGTRAQILADPWCEQWLQNFASFLVCVKPSKRDKFDEVIELTLQSLSATMDALDASDCPEMDE